MKISVNIYQDEDGMYIAECPSVPGCVSQGASQAEAQANITEAIRDCMTVRAEQHLPASVAIQEIEVTV